MMAFYGHDACTGDVHTSSPGILGHLSPLVNAEPNCRMNVCDAVAAGADM